MVLGGLHDHPDPLEFTYRLRGYILGRNEGSLSFGRNTMEDSTPDLDAVVNLSSSLLKSLAPTDSPNVEDVAEELDSLHYDGLEHLTGYICHRLKDPDLYESPSQPSTSYTWTDQLSEGFLKKPTKQLMGHMEKLENIFNETNGEGIVFQKNFIGDLIKKAKHVECSDKVKRLFFRSRMYFRLKALNTQLANNNIFVSRKRK